MDERTGAGRRLLLVDDEPELRLLLQEALRWMGFTVDTAGSVAEGAARCARDRYDLALLDKHLPDGSGLTLARQVAAAQADCEILIMSGDPRPSPAVEASQCRVADSLVKPLSLDDLEARLRRITEAQELKRRNRQLTAEVARKDALLESLAVRDVVTRLFNHAHFQEALERELRRSERHHLSFGVVLLEGWVMVRRANRKKGKTS